MQTEMQKLADRMIDHNKKEVENLVTELFETITLNAEINDVDEALSVVAASRGSTSRQLVGDILEFATLWESANKGFSSAPEWLIAILSDESFGWIFKQDGKGKSAKLHQQTRRDALNNFTVE